MENMKIVILLTCYLMLNVFYTFSQVLNSKEQIIITAAEQNLTDFLNKIPTNFEASYGFNNRSEFDAVKIGLPIRLYTIEKSDLVQLDLWRVPLIVDGEYRALLTINKVNSDYNIVNFGATILASDIQRKIIEIKKKGNKELTTIAMLRLYNEKCDFLAKKTQTDTTFVPLTSGELFINTKNIQGENILPNQSFSQTKSNAILQQYTLSQIIDLIEQ